MNVTLTGALHAGMLLPGLQAHAGFLLWTRRRLVVSQLCPCAAVLCCALLCWVVNLTYGDDISTFSELRYAALRHALPKPRWYTKHHGGTPSIHLVCQAQKACPA